MLKFYHHPQSPMARQVWIALLEKEISFTPIIVDAKKKEQLKKEFLAINPFHHIPVIIDNDLRVLESLAILDYLESQYPNIPLLPSEPARLATVRMAQMVVSNELSSLVISLIPETEDSSKRKETKRKITKVLEFLAELLGDDIYFGGENLSLGDIVAGNATILASKLGYDLSQVETIQQWCDRLMQRDAWQQTQPNVEQIEMFKQTVEVLVNDGLLHIV